MMDVTVNIPEVVAEVRALFERYEQALIDKNVEVLDATFWDSPHTIRYAFHENGYGFAQIHAHRVARPPGPGTKEKAAPATSAPPPARRWRALRRGRRLRRQPRRRREDRAARRPPQRRRRGPRLSREAPRS
jgi:Protein of unknown function (DUF3225)